MSLLILNELGCMCVHIIIYIYICVCVCVYRSHKVDSRPSAYFSQSDDNFILLVAIPESQ